jgi:hypothetical protein
MKPFFDASHEGLTELVRGFLFVALRSHRLYFCTPLLSHVLPAIGFVPTGLAASQQQFLGARVTSCSFLFSFNFGRATASGSCARCCVSRGIAEVILRLRLRKTETSGAFRLNHSYHGS